MDSAYAAHLPHILLIGLIATASCSSDETGELDAARPWRSLDLDAQIASDAQSPGPSTDAAADTGGNGTDAATSVDAATPPTDAGSSPADTGSVPTDTGGGVDATIPPAPDATIPPAPDATVPPAPDATVPPIPDAGGPPIDAGGPPTDAGMASAQVTQICTTLCTELGACMFPMFDIQQCISGCTADLLDCSPSELTQLTSCSGRPCPPASSSLTDCIMAVACTSL